METITTVQTANLSESAVLITFSTGMWSARKLDREITNEVHTTHNAKSDAGRYNKLLIAKEHLQPIQKVITTARAYHYETTLPWGDNNERLLTNEMYFDYITQMNQYETEFKIEVQRFINKYDTIVTEARIRLNGMFKETDYPRRDEVENKFDFGLTFMPVPVADIRVKLSGQAVADITRKVEAEISQRLTDAVKNVWDRIGDKLRAMRDKLADKEGIFRDSLFENVRELVDILPRLNVTKSPELDEIAEQMKGLLVDPDVVRGNSVVRSEKAQEVDNILKKFSGWF